MSLNLAEERSIELGSELLARGIGIEAGVFDLGDADAGRPRLWHGDGRATWAVVDAGLADGHDVRVGLEDTLIDRDGTPAPSNPDQVKRILAGSNGQ